jgi:hypothetical protein
LILSRVRPKDAIQPRAPKKMSAKGNTMAELSHFDNGHVILLAKM